MCPEGARLPGRVVGTYGRGVGDRSDETDLAAHADAFEAVNNAILAELRRLEAL